MPDREKVIKAIESHIAGVQCEDCPYKDECDYTDKMPAVLGDALALLKEQEARVLNLFEIKLDTVYWMEKANIVRPWPVAFARLHGNPEKLFYEEYYGEDWDVSEYRIAKKGWRCWTSRPTDEQRKAVPWEDDDA